MEAEFLGGRFEPPRLQVAFGERSGDGKRLVPETRGIARGIRWRVGIGEAGAERHTRQFAQYVTALAAGKAGDEDAAFALPECQAWREIGVSRTQEQPRNRGGAGQGGYGRVEP